MLLSAGAARRAQDWQGATPFLLACRRGHMAVAQLLAAAAAVEEEEVVEEVTVPLTLTLTLTLTRTRTRTRSLTLTLTLPLKSISTRGPATPRR